MVQILPSTRISVAIGLGIVQDIPHEFADQQKFAVVMSLFPIDDSVTVLVHQ